MLIELRSVTKKYPGLPQPVLSDMNLNIEPGGRLVVLGNSGAGKSTLLGILGLLLRPDQGQVLIEGEDADRWGERKRAGWRNQNLGYVFQDFGLLPELTVEENVSLPLRMAGLPLKQGQAKDLLRRVGLTDRIRAYPKELSGGEAQRVAIARALVGSPAVVLADEPTGNLQTSQGEQIGLLFRELQEEQGFSLVVVTHNEYFARVLQGEVVRISEGRIHAQSGEEDIIWRMP